MKEVRVKDSYCYMVKLFMATKQYAKKRDR